MGFKVSLFKFLSSSCLADRVSEASGQGAHRTHGKSFFQGLLLQAHIHP